MLSPGDKAPAFELPNADMNMSRSSDFAGKIKVIFFYPKDDTPGCTLEALAFTDLMDDFEAAGAAVIGVSKDTCISHGDFRDKFGLTMQLLADVEGQMCEAYDVWQEKEKNGEKKMGIVRSTFIVDQDDVICHALYGVTPKGHAEEVLALVQAL